MPGTRANFRYIVKVFARESGRETERERERESTTVSAISTVFGVEVLLVRVALQASLRQAAPAHRPQVLAAQLSAGGVSWSGRKGFR